MTDFLHTDARWGEHFVEVSDPHKEGHHVRFYFERPWVGLTQEEIEDSYNADYKVQTKAIERLLKEKNT